MEIPAWSDFKTLISNKGLLMQYSESSSAYDVYGPEAGTFLWRTTILKGSSDATDFENNYKTAANAPLMLNGALVQVHVTGEIQIFTAEAIRDTNAHNSATGANTGFRVKTIVIHNGLNQAVSIQCQGSRNGSTWINVGSAFNVAASTNTYESSETYFPSMRLVATASVAPTTGTLDAWFERTGG